MEESTSRGAVRAALRVLLSVPFAVLVGCALVVASVLLATSHQVEPPLRSALQGVALFSAIVSTGTALRRRQRRKRDEE